MRVIVRVHFPAESPGVWPIPDGYRPTCWIGRVRNGQKLYHDASLTWDAGLDQLERGSSALALLEPLRPEFWCSVKAGTEIELSEGPIVVATAVVQEVQQGSD